MKKIFVLLIAISFLVGCATLFRDPRVRVEMKLENIAKTYQVIGDVFVKINGQDRDVKVAEKVFGDFGFQVIDEKFLSDPDFVILVERENLGGGGNSSYSLGYSNTQKQLVRARMVVSNKGVKKTFEDVTSYSYRTSYFGGYQSRYSYQSDPGEVAFHGALMTCIGKFIDEADIPYKKLK